MTNFVYISPGFPPPNVHFCEYLAKAGVHVLGIGDTPYDQLPALLKTSLTEYYRVDSLENYDQVYRGVAFLAYKHGRIDWIESNNEYWLPMDARLRDDFHVTTGFGTDILDPIKSKSSMKPVYAFAGIPTARQVRVTDADGVLAFAAEVGFPLVAKPEYGVGANNTCKLNNADEVHAFFPTPPAVPFVVEEFVSGDLVSYDAILDAQGQPLFEAATLWPPSIMDIVCDQLDIAYRISAEVPPALAEIGRRAATAFGMRSRFVHEEFFRLTADKPGLGAKGDYVGLEVNMRPAGGFTVDMYNFARSANVYQIYADLVTGRDTGAAAAARRDPQFCVYGGRRAGVAYALSWDDLLAKYRTELVAQGTTAPLFIPQQGNFYAMMITRSEARADEFERDVTTRL